MTEELNTKRGRGRPATGRKKRKYISVAERGLPDRRNGNPGNRGGGQSKSLGEKKRKKWSTTFSQEVLEAVEKIAKANGMSRSFFIEKCVVEEILRAGEPESTTGINADSDKKK